MNKIKLILSLLEKREKRHLIFVLFAMLVMGFVELIGIGSISPFISIASNPGVIHTNEYLNMTYNYFQFTSDNSFIIAFGIVVIIILALSNLCIFSVIFITYIYSGKRKYSISMRLLEKYLRQPYIFYLNINTSDLSKNLLNDVPVFVNSVLQALLQLVSSVVISIAIIILLIIINPLLALILSSALGFLYVIIFSLVKNFLVRKGNERFTRILLKYKYINEAFGGIKDIKIFGKESVFLNFFSVPSKELIMNEAVSESVNDLPKYLLETVALGGMILVIIFMIRSGMKIDDFLPTLAVYAFGAYRLLPTLQKIFRAVASIRYNFPVVENLYNDFSKLPEGIALIKNKMPRMNFSREILLDNIVFAYPNTDKDILKSQSLKIKANTSIAIVGATGCGKTTLADIILGLLEPQKGKIFVDDIEIDSMNIKNWQMNLGYVPQSIFLTDDTIRNNIAFGITPQDIDDGAVTNAAKIANIHDFVMTELKEGYDTVIGERGIRLSGGQRQRIGIARAVYHNPSVLILDEATSALDSLTENAIMDAIKNISHKKTIIMIAHRITTIKTCDIIYLMEKGVIADYGDYNGLYSRNKSFRKMADGM
ncbi:MAG: ABC transporter ATP-binding protein/permease [Bacteroidales bacterium]|jgi:ABC-type multidrug transport system fused ATPase/permease subunit|nr:ABC transporter ATP-binding protein/permease [Bacteroidales bacterium]